MLRIWCTKDSFHSSAYNENENEIIAKLLFQKEGIEDKKEVPCRIWQGSMHRSEEILSYQTSSIQETPILCPILCQPAT